MPKIIDITELILRDAHQSVMATRMATEDMAPACEDIDKAGFWSVECWGGATFDSCIRFLNEDPWERLRTFRKLMPNTRLQMLLRGQNLLGYRHYEDTVVDRFVEKAAENGIDVFRIFDALNDIRNLQRAIAAVKKTGKHAQGAISYTISPLHTIKGFVEHAQKLVALGCDSICIKDMAALLKPQPAYDLVKGIKEACGKDVRVQVHVHATTGVTMVSLMKAIEAGADGVDTAISALSLGPGHNPTESLVEMLEGTGFDTKIDKKRLLKIKKHFVKIAPRYKEFISNITGVETEIFESQIPGGMLSNMESQLKQQKADDRTEEVLAEVPKVRERLGLPAAGYADQPDRGITGGLQCADGKIQGPDRRIRRPDAGLLRRNHRAAQSGGHRAGGQADRQAPDHLPSRRPPETGVAGPARSGAGITRLQRHR